ncbi:MAG TPA: hypothetical protein VJQ07_07390 [Gaiellaceae bacterium]|jgi:hypothetical protein|nr:hypothetical protein [Gaiellaceae bacterium]
MKIRKPTPAGAVLAGVVLVLSLALVPTAFAGKGGGGGHGGGTISSPIMVVDKNGDGLPNFGDTITFTVSTSASFPSVQLACYQNGTLVYTATKGFYPTYMWSDNYLLEGGYWSGGAASCTATLYNTSKNGSNTTLATLSVPVAA